jgi:ABC-type nitrate/sulfonate/bicarbonate transport system substrate-binding protein
LARETQSRRVLTLSIAAALLLLACGGAALWVLTRTAQPPERLSIALPTTPHAALLFIAAAQGYFAAEGLDVTVKPVSHGKAALDLLAQGQVDLASAAEVPFVISLLKGERLGLAATVASVSTEMAVVSRKDRAIRSPRDLAGKRIGVTFGTSGDYFLWAFLIRNKIGPDAVTLVDVPPGRMVHELAQGTIDAVSTWEPIKSQAHLALAGNALSFLESEAYTVTHAVIGASGFLQSRPAAIEKLVRALLRAEDFSQSQPQQALALVASQLKLDVKTLQAGWGDIAFKVDLRQSQLVTLEDEARWAMARGYVDKRPLPNFLSSLYLDALLDLAPERVTVVH